MAIMPLFLNYSLPVTWSMVQSPQNTVLQLPFYSIGSGSRFNKFWIQVLCPNSACLLDPFKST